MPLPSSIYDLSTSAASNSPAGFDSIGTSLDDYLRAIQAIIKQQFSTGTQLASGSTITPQADGNFINVTGTSSITGIASTNSWNGRIVVLKFSDALTLTHSANLVLPNAANITTATNDVFSFVQESTGVWLCISAPTSVSRALAVLSVDVGHASDTTLTRASAGTLAVEGVNLLTTATGAALAGSNLTGGLNSARGNITQHATTMNFFATSSPDILDGTGSAVTITACTNAPQAGATRRFYPLVNTVLTHGATFDIAGNVNLTAAAGDCWIIEAKTVSTYRVTAVKEDGTAVVGSITYASAAENIAGTIENKAVDPLGIREAFNCTGSAPVYACRAWVNFNGTGTVAIRASGNVTSITDNGTGDYTVNFTTAMPDVNYTTQVNGLGTTNISMQPGGPRSQATNLTTSVQIGFGTVGNAGATNTATDPEVANVAVFR